MSYLARASRTGVEKVAVAIVLTRRRRQLSALQGAHGRDAFACGAAVRVDATAVGPAAGCKGDVCSRLPQLSRSGLRKPCYSALLRRCETLALGRGLHLLPSPWPPQKSLASCKTLANFFKIAMDRSVLEGLA